IAGQLPKKDGRVLNLDFETGTLQDWTAKGEAFSTVLVVGDSSPVHDTDMHLGQTGKYFVSSEGTQHNEVAGTLTSVPFEVTQAFAAFHISGGALKDTRVELVRNDNDSVIFQITGSGRAPLQPVIVDLQRNLGKKIFIRIIEH